jgi:uncharacterized protein (DUF1778 family)
MDKDTHIQVRVSQKTKQRFCQLASAEGLTLTEWILAQCTDSAHVMTKQKRSIITVSKPQKISMSATAHPLDFNTVIPVMTVKPHHPRCQCAMCKPS